jgi:hypothetical protein
MPTNPFGSIRIQYRNFCRGLNQRSDSCRRNGRRCGRRWGCCRCRQWRGSRLRFPMPHLVSVLVDHRVLLRRTLCILSLRCSRRKAISKPLVLVAASFRHDENRTHYRIQVKSCRAFDAPTSENVWDVLKDGKSRCFALSQIHSSPFQLLNLERYALPLETVRECVYFAASPCRSTRYGPENASLNCL